MMENDNCLIIFRQLYKILIFFVFLENFWKNQYSRTFQKPINFDKFSSFWHKHFGNTILAKTIGRSLKQSSLEMSLPTIVDVLSISLLFHFNFSALVVAFAA